jgi:hypothetical protein
MFVDEKRQGEIAIDPIRDILIKAKRILIERGWCQGAYWKGKHEAFCCLGAIANSSRDKLTSEDCMNYCDACDRLKTSIKCDDIPAWNDSPERTKTEILAAFDRAIAL